MERRLSFRSSVVSFVIVLAVIVAATATLLVVLDPRAQAFWGTRLGELGAFLASLLPDG
ncbi:MAG TPA: hypothetical protein VMJ92_00950 [Candidatus Limnocylindrales bacterium]|nr:hypothetical protein [Candidatus Limnocylindrales bacterium]